MQELTINEVVEVSGGGGRARLLRKSFEFGYFLGEGINWLMENSYGGRGQFPTPPRAGHE